MTFTKGIGGDRSDMGAYGGGDSPITVIFEDHFPVPDIFMLMQNYPNPFNSSTTIEYGLPEPGHVKIEIYDLLGRKVETIVDEQKQAGTHSITFDASDL